MSEGWAVNRDEGARLLGAGDLEGALRLLQQAVAQNPADARSYGYLGVCQARRGDMAAAVQALGQAAMLDPNDAGVQYNFAVALHRAGRLADAAGAADRVLALDPGHSRAAELLERIRAEWPGAHAEPAAPPSDAGVPAWQPAPEQQPGFGASSAGATAAPPTAAGGMHYQTQAEPAAKPQPPPLGRRLLRGWLWGIGYGQWWTLWTAISMALWGHVSFDAAMVFGLLLFAMVYGFFGSVAGLAIAATNADLNRGMMIGIGIGMLLLLGEMTLTHSAMMLVNIFFYFFTGRFIGSGLVRRVQQPV